MTASRCEASCIGPVSASRRIQGSAAILRPLSGDFPMNTSFARKLGLKVPIFQAPMAGATVPELVLAVGRAGALGGFGFAYTEPAAMKEAVQKVRSAADVPIHINLFVERPAPAVSRQALAEAAQRLKPFFEALKLPIPETLPPPYCPDLSAQIETALSLKPALVSFQFH